MITEADIYCIRQICALISDNTFVEFGGNRKTIRDNMDAILRDCEAHRGRDILHVPVSIELTVGISKSDA